MLTNTCGCRKCGYSTVAEIKEATIHGMPYKKYVPVWFCSKCDISYPTTENEKNRWVKKYIWKHTTYLSIPTGAGPSLECLGCGRHPMSAETEYTVSSFAFPFHTLYTPVWRCHTCGYTSITIDTEKYIWAEKYKDWKRSV
jgi:hypothetical protein